MKPSTAICRAPDSRFQHDLGYNSIVITGFLPLAYPRLGAMVIALAQNSAPWLFTGGKVVPTLIALSGLAAFLWFVTRTKAAFINLCRKNLPVLTCWTIAAMILPFIYFAMFWAAHFYARTHRLSV